MRVGNARILSVTAALLVVVSLHAQERAIPGAVQPFVSVNAAVVALTHVQLVEGTGVPARADQTVILRGSTIESIGPFATTAVPPGARVLDLSGHTVMPGQVGLHEHTYIASIEGTSGRPTRIAHMNTSAPLLYLAYGVTTAMTAGVPCRTTSSICNGLWTRARRRPAVSYRRSIPQRTLDRAVDIAECGHGDVQARHHRRGGAASHCLLGVRGRHLGEVLGRHHA